MDEIKKEQQELFKSAIARLKTAGVDTNCYKDVVIALDTEIRHYRDVIDRISGRGGIPGECSDHGAFVIGWDVGMRALASRLISHFTAEAIDQGATEELTFNLEDLTLLILGAWAELQDEGPADG